MSPNDYISRQYKHSNMLKIINTNYKIEDYDLKDNETQISFKQTFITAFESGYEIEPHNKDIQLKDIQLISSMFTPNTGGQPDILGHTGNTLGVNGIEIGVLEETNRVGLSSFL